MDKIYYNIIKETYSQLINTRGHPPKDKTKYAIYMGRKRAISQLKDGHSEQKYSDEPYYENLERIAYMEYYRQLCITAEQIIIENIYFDADKEIPYEPINFEDLEVRVLQKNEEQRLIQNRINQLKILNLKKQALQKEQEIRSNEADVEYKLRKAFNR